MTTKQHIQKSLALAFPVILTQVGQISVNVVDSIMVGKLGSDKIAAVSLANAVFYSVLLFGIGFSFSISPLVAQAHAKHKIKRIKNVFKHSLFLNISLSIFLFLLLYFCIPLLDYTHQTPEILPDAKIFLLINLASLLPFMIFQTYRQTAEGLSIIFPVTIATIIANLLNVLLNYALIYGNWGFPKMEVEGSAWATFISRVVMCVLLILFLHNYKKSKIYFNAISYIKVKKDYFRKLIQLGFPTACQMFFEVSAFAIAAFICGYNSQTNELAAHQITINLASISFMICTGLGVSATIRVGNQLGLQDFKTLQKAAFTNIFLVIIFMSFCGIIFIMCRNILPAYYLKEGQDVEVLAIAANLMIIAALFQISDGIQLVALGALRGLQDVKIPTIITFVAYYVVTLPLAWVLAVVFDYKALGVWIALGIGLCISAILLIWRLRNKTNKLIYLNNKL